MIKSIETLLGEKRRADIPIEDLKPSSLNTFMMVDVDDLAASIRRLGLIDPLIVAGPDEEGKYEILSGERRYRAILQINEEDRKIRQEEADSLSENADSSDDNDPEKTELSSVSASDSDSSDSEEERHVSLPITEVACEIVGAADLDPIIKQIVIEESNTETRHDIKWDSHRFRLVSLYETLVEENIIPEKELSLYISKSLGVSQRYARMYRVIHKQAVPELKEAVTSTKKKADSEEEGPVHIPVHNASVFSSLPDEEQKKVVSRVNQGENPDDIQSEIIAKRKKERDEQNRLNSIFSIPGGNGKPRSGEYKEDEYNPDYRSSRSAGIRMEDDDDEENRGFNDLEESEEPEEWDDTEEEEMYSSDSTIPFRPGKKYEDTDIGEELDGMEERLTGSGIMMPRENLNRDTTGMIGSLMQDDKVPEGTRKRVLHEEHTKLLKMSDRSMLSEKYETCFMECAELISDDLERAYEDPAKARLSWSDPVFRKILRSASRFLSAADVPEDFDL